MIYSLRSFDVIQNNALQWRSGKNRSNKLRSPCRATGGTEADVTTSTTCVVNAIAYTRKKKRGNQHEHRETD